MNQGGGGAQKWNVQGSTSETKGQHPIENVCCTVYSVNPMAVCI